VGESTKPAEQPEGTGNAGGDEADQGDFTMQELMRAYDSNFDHLGRRIDRPAEDK